MKNLKSSSKQAVNLTIMQALIQVLSESELGSQEDIALQLKKYGFTVNQTKVSRLLHKLGAIKMLSRSGVAIYRLPEHNASFTPTVSPDKTLSKLIISIKHNENLIVIRTTPGSASLIGSLLDQLQLAIIGTIAGDDTLFIAPQSVKQIPTIIKKISQTLSLPSTGQVQE